MFRESGPRISGPPISDPPKVPNTGQIGRRSRWGHPSTIPSAGCPPTCSIPASSQSPKARPLRRERNYKSIAPQLGIVTAVSLTFFTAAMGNGGNKQQGTWCWVPSAQVSKQTVPAHQGRWSSREYEGNNTSGLKHRSACWSTT